MARRCALVAARCWRQRQRTSSCSTTPTPRSRIATRKASLHHPRTSYPDTSVGESDFFRLLGGGWRGGAERQPVARQGNFYHIHDAERRACPHGRNDSVVLNGAAAAFVQSEAACAPPRGRWRRRGKAWGRRGSTAPVLWRDGVPLWRHDGAPLGRRDAKQVSCGRATLLYQVGLVPR